VPSITGLLISPPGANASLVDISASGLLAEADVPLRVGQKVKIRFEGTFNPSSTEARVVRSSVAAMTRAGVRYHVGLAFSAPIALDDSPGESAPQPGAVQQTRGEPHEPGEIERAVGDANTESQRDGNREKVGGSSPALEPSPRPVINRW
jgi:hypothetical protein